MAFTPWGQSQQQTTWAPGIIDYSTAGHGGVYLDKERQAQLPDWARINNWVGTHQWWEEDEDWCVPFLAFLDDIRAYAAEHPDEWWAKRIDNSLEHALNTAKACHPTVYAGYMASQSIKPQ